MDISRGSLVVHNYAPSRAQNRKTSSLSSDELLSRGRDLVSAIESRNRWRTVTSPSDPFLHLGKTLALKNAPPFSSSLGHDLGEFRSEEAATAKDRTPDAKEIPGVARLKEFEGSDFSFLLTRAEPLEPPANSSGKGKQTEKDKRKHRHENLNEVDDVGEQRKKKRRPIETMRISSLYNLIPHPHHHSYSSVVGNHRPNLDITKRFPPFSKSPFIPIAPFTQSKAEKYFKDPYARSVWLIPITGRLPWEDASPARLKDNSTNYASQSGQISTQSDPITWTPFVINNFWSDLLEIRKQGALGAISLSFHAASMEKTQVHAKKMTTNVNHPAAKKAKSTDQPPTQSDLPKSLEQCTYIKVYHDVRYAMYVRSVFDAWRTEVEVKVDATSVASRVTMSPRRTRSTAVTSSAPPLPKKIKVRPLQGVKLVLLDEAGQAVGVS